MQPSDTIEIETSTIGCDGGGGPLGHPMVYLNLEAKGAVDCPYCGCHFVRRADKAAPSDH
ncbi:MAG: zinc-finger domain-containing protein [Alphaproteobacteria bacterium]|nr:zinc-finger domain-containing protein [Alphaproteobacteria bacterium]